MRILPHSPAPLLCFASLLVTFPALAEPKPWPSQLTGTIVETHDDLTTQAKLWWQAPDRLRIEVQPDPAGPTPATVAVAAGDSTFLFEPSTGRVSRLGYNVAKEWWRSPSLATGGSDLLFLSGTPAPGPNAPGSWHRDTVLFGGGGQSAFYAAYKSWVGFGPAFDAVRGGPPVSTVTRDGAGGVTVVATSPDNTDTFTYTLHPVAEPFGPAQFQLPTAAGEAIVEDAAPKAPAAYAAGGDASSLFNLGMAHLLGSEDYPAAYAAFAAAATSAPHATAPALATFEAAMASRDLPRAQTALNQLAPLALDPVELEVRRARLAVSQHDWKGAHEALQRASLAAPKNVAVQLFGAQIDVARGDLDSARTGFVDLLKENASPTPIAVTAASALARIGTAPALASVPTTTEPQELAHALWSLALGEAPPQWVPASASAQAALAFAEDTAGRHAAAKNLWASLTQHGDDAQLRVAAMHLMAEDALLGDADGSLAALRLAAAHTQDEDAREAQRSALFDAWQKASRLEVLRSALENRAQATGATSADQRLWLGWQQAYGTPEESAATVERNAGAWPNDSFWLSSWADLLADQATHQHDNTLGMAQREQLFDQALALVERAMAASPRQPFYAMQRALIAVRRSTAEGIVVDAVAASANRAAALAALQQLGHEWPNDPDAMVSAALGYAALKTAAERRNSQELALAALATGPGDGPRHVLVSAARQSLALSWRTDRNPAEAANQYLLLLSGAQDSGEELGIAAAYVEMLASTTGSGPATAQLLQQVAAEPWDYTSSRALLDSVCEQVAATPLLAQAALAQLRATPRPAAALATVALAAAEARKANREVQVAGAPPTADAAVDRANADLRAALPLLVPAETGPDPLLSARASALEAENSTGPRALAALGQAVAAQPEDPALQLTLIDALLGSGDAVRAQHQRDLAEQTLPPSAESWRRLAAASDRAGEGAAAYRLAQEAYETAISDPEVDLATYERSAFTAAKACFENGQVARGTAIYRSLTTSPWDPIDQGAALAAEYSSWSALHRQDEMAAVQNRISALKLTPADATAAKAFLSSLEE